MIDATWECKVVGWDLVAPDQLLANPVNFRRHPTAQREALRGSLNELGIIAPVIVNRQTEKMLDGHARVEEYLSRGIAKVPVVYVDVPPEKEALALLSLDPIAAMAQADTEALDSLLHEVATSEAGLQRMLADLAKDAGLYLDAAEPEASRGGALCERFGVPPFSVLDARQGYWQERKKAWAALGIQSELGRGGGLTWGDSQQVTEPGLNYYRNRAGGR